MRQIDKRKKNVGKKTEGVTETATTISSSVIVSHETEITFIMDSGSTSHLVHPFVESIS